MGIDPNKPMPASKPAAVPSPAGVKVANSPPAGVHDRNNGAWAKPRQQPFGMPPEAEGETSMLKMRAPQVVVQVDEAGEWDEAVPSKASSHVASSKAHGPAGIPTTSSARNPSPGRLPSPAGNDIAVVRNMDSFLQNVGIARGEPLAMSPESPEDRKVAPPKSGKSNKKKDDEAHPEPSAGHSKWGARAPPVFNVPNLATAARTGRRRAEATEAQKPERLPRDRNKPVIYGMDSLPQFYSW